MNKIILFESKKIRRAWHDNQWFFSIVDVVESLTNSANATDYLKKLRKRDSELGLYIVTNCPQVEMVTELGKKRKTLAGNVRKETEKEIGKSVISKKNYLENEKSQNFLDDNQN
jgi:heterodisulfide reductase subunit C